MARVRLQKFLADAGVTSRRAGETLILEGHVLVNEQVVDALPAFVDPAVDRVRVDGVPVRPGHFEYFILHKPKNVVAAAYDGAGRTLAVALLPPLPARLVPVGRLEPESTGLLLLTNDEQLRGQVADARSGLPVTYVAEVRGRISEETVRRMRSGVHLAEGKARVLEAEILHASSERSALRVTLRESTNRQLRRILAKLGHAVRKLHRTDIGLLHLRKLPVGACRRLAARELAALQAALQRADVQAHEQPPSLQRRRLTSATRSGERRAVPATKSSREVRRRSTAPRRAPRRDSPGSGPTRRVIT